MSAGESKRLRDLDVEQVGRWVALAAALVGVGGFAVTAGAQVHPLVGWAAFAVPALAAAVRLWSGEFQRRAAARDYQAARQAGGVAEPYGGPAAPSGGLTLPDGYGPGRG